MGKAYTGRKGARRGVGVVWSFHPWFRSARPLPRLQRGWPMGFLQRGASAQEPPSTRGIGSEWLLHRTGFSESRIRVFSVRFSVSSNKVISHRLLGGKKLQPVSEKVDLGGPAFIDCLFPFLECLECPTFSTRNRSILVVPAPRSVLLWKWLGLVETGASQ